MTEPEIIRQNTLHEVTVTDGSQVAASKSLDPQGPQVRRTLAGESDAHEEPDPGQPLPPRLEPAEPVPTTVFERSVGQAVENRQAAPPASAAQAGDAIVFERSIQTDPSQAVDAAADADAAPRLVADAAAPPPDRFVTDAPAGPPPEAASGPVFERGLHDHREALPADGPAGGPAEPGPQIERALQDRFVALPPEALSEPNIQVLPPQEPGRAAAPMAAPGLPPVPTAQAQEAVAETAREVQARVEETLGAADQAWVEMDFPARVIRLKIENDKVRSKLEQLQAMTLRI